MVDLFATVTLLTRGLFNIWGEWLGDHPPGPGAVTVRLKSLCLLRSLFLHHLMEYF